MSNFFMSGDEAPPNHTIAFDLCPHLLVPSFTTKPGEWWTLLRDWVRRVTNQYPAVRFERSDIFRTVFYSLVGDIQTIGIVPKGLSKDWVVDQLHLNEGFCTSYMTPEGVENLVRSASDEFDIDNRLQIISNQVNPRSLRGMKYIKLINYADELDFFNAVQHESEFVKADMGV